VEQVWDAAMAPVKKRRSPAVTPARSRNGRKALNRKAED
jgi:hypothetical protein